MSERKCLALSPHGERCGKVAGHRDGEHQNRYSGPVWRNEGVSISAPDADVIEFAVGVLRTEGFDDIAARLEVIIYAKLTETGCSAVSTPAQTDMRLPDV